MMVVPSLVPFVQIIVYDKYLICAPWNNILRLGFILHIFVPQKANHDPLGHWLSFSIVKTRPTFVLS